MTYAGLGGGMDGQLNNGEKELSKGETDGQKTDGMVDRQPQRFTDS